MDARSVDRFRAWIIAVGTTESIDVQVSSLATKREADPKNPMMITPPSANGGYLLLRR